MRNKPIKRTKPQMFLVVGVTNEMNAYNMLAKLDTEEEAVKEAGRLAAAYVPASGYKGIAVYELKGMARRPEVPVNFVTIQSMEANDGPSSK